MSRFYSIIYITFSFLKLIVIIYDVLAHFDGNRTNFMLPENAAQTHSRKLLLHGSCTNRDISVSQSRYLTRGIPKFMVEIVNTCVSGCSPSKIHLHCGWFASATFVNPENFKRLSYDDCIVNGGRPLRVGRVIRFTYSNSFMYPLSFKNAEFC